MTKTAAHTPGMWKLENPEMDGEILVTDEQDVVIATVWKQPLDPAEWVEANALLIAAAPELLETLQSIFEHDCEYADLEDLETMLARIKEKARAAIAKAKEE